MLQARRRSAQERRQFGGVEHSIFIGIEALEHLLGGGALGKARSARSARSGAKARRGNFAVLDVLMESGALGFVELAIVVEVIFVEDFLWEMCRWAAWAARTTFERRSGRLDFAVGDVFLEGSHFGLVELAIMVRIVFLQQIAQHLSEADVRKTRGEVGCVGRLIGLSPGGQPRQRDDKRGEQGEFVLGFHVCLYSFVFRLSFRNARCVGFLMQM